MKLLKTGVRRCFPEVPQLPAAQLADWLKNPERKPPLLLDVRTKEEFELGHLPGAHRVDADALIGDLEKQFNLDQAIVLYCAGGYRSSRLVRRLRRSGYKQVSNLEGAVFQWATDGHPLERSDGSPTDKVHPVDWLSARFLPRKRRAKTTG